jgi:hypothetical protein
MTPKFLREEAARFRGMAETVEREASRQRLLTMAIDYEAKAKAADDLPEPSLDVPIQDVPIQNAPIQDAPVKVRLSRRTTGASAP